FEHGRSESMVQADKGRTRFAIGRRGLARVETRVGKAGEGRGFGRQGLGQAQGKVIVARVAARRLFLPRKSPSRARPQGGERGELVARIDAETALREAAAGAEGVGHDGSDAARERRRLGPEPGEGDRVALAEN